MLNLKLSTLDFYKLIEHDINHVNYLQSTLKILKFFTNALTALNFIIFNSNILIFIVSIFTQEHFLLLSVYIPFIDHNSTFGYLLNISFHITMGLFGFHTFTSFDTSIILYGYHGNIILKVFVEKFNDLEVILGYDEGQIEVQYKIKSLLEFLEEYQKYFEKFERVVKLPFLTAIGLNFLGLILCIYVGLNVSVVLGVEGSIGLLISFILPCIMVIFLDIQVSQRIQFLKLFKFFPFQKTTAIKVVSEFPWHQLQPKNRKLFLKLLRYIDNACRINLPFLGFLDFTLIAKMLFTFYKFIAYFLVFALFHSQRVIT